MNQSSGQQQPYLQSQQSPPGPTQTEYYRSLTQQQTLSQQSATVVKQQPHQQAYVKYEMKPEDPFRRAITPPFQNVTTPVAAPSTFPINPVATINSTVSRVKYEEWLKVEVCREFQRDKCNRKPVECKYAHPKPNVSVENGKVTACYDFLKGKCHRGDTCRFIHPENPNIKAQLEMNGRNAQYQRKLNSRMVMNQFTTDYTMVNCAQPVQPMVASTLMLFNNEAPSRPIRADRLEICRDFLRSTCTRNDLLKEGRSPDKLTSTLCKYAHPEKIKDEFNTDRSMIDETDNTVIVCMDFVKGKCHRDNKCKYYHPEAHLINEIKHRQSLLSSHLHAHNNNTTTYSFEKPLLTASSPLSTGTQFSVPVVPSNIKYETSYQPNDYKRQMRSFDQRAATASPVQTPTSAPWTSYSSTPQQTSFVPTMVFNYPSSFGQPQMQPSNYTLGQSLSNGNVFQSNGSQQNQPATINPMTMSIGTWSSEQDMRMDPNQINQNIMFQQNQSHSQTYDTGYQ